MAKKKTDKAAPIIEMGGAPTLSLREEPESTSWVTTDQGPMKSWLSFAGFIQGATVQLRCLDGADVELYVNGERVIFDDGIILRWGRKR